MSPQQQPDSSVPRIRRATLPTDVRIVVRGDSNDDDSVHQAAAFRRRYAAWGRWGLSAYYARSEAEIDDLASDQLERFPTVIVLSLVDLVAADFEVVPTFRTPHVTIAFTGDLVERLGEMTRLGTDRRPNRYYRDEPTD